MAPTETPENEDLSNLTPVEPVAPSIDNAPIEPSPEDVTTFEEDDDPESNVGDESEETAEEKAAADEVDSVE